MASPCPSGPDPDSSPPEPWATDPEAWRGAPAPDAYDAHDAPTLHAVLGACHWPQLDAAPLYWMWLARFEEERGISS